MIYYLQIFSTIIFNDYLTSLVVSEDTHSTPIIDFRR